MKTTRRNFFKTALAAIGGALLSACDIVWVKEEPIEDKPSCPLDLHVSYGQCRDLDDGFIGTVSEVRDDGSVIVAIGTVQPNTADYFYIDGFVFDRDEYSRYLELQIPNSNSHLTFSQDMGPYYWNGKEWMPLI